MDFRVLGPVEVRVDGQVLDAGPPQQRHLLAILAVSAGRPVTAEVLIDRVWDDAPPPSARRTLHVYVTRLRRLLEARLTRRSGGYVLDVDPDQVDVHRFERLTRLARGEGADSTQRTRLLREALDLWQGEPLAGLPGQWAQRTRQAWRQQYVDAALCWAESELQHDNPGAAIGTLIELAGEYPLMESVAALQMRVLHAADRTAEALDCYAQIRRRLAEELGTDPGEGLRLAQAEILRSGRVPVVAALRPMPGGTVPAQLPPDAYGFAGRTEHLRLLDQLAAHACDDDHTATVVSILFGTAGVGKTALALHWAHQAKASFPDGQLYANLRGFGPTEQPMSSAEALRGFLDALGVPPERIPHGVDQQTGLYRSIIAGKRLLVVLDNARDADQVRPLLPGAPGCLVLVTSRNQLTGLVATGGAHPLALDVMSTMEARELLVRRLGRDRVAAEPGAVDQILASCARLPLALSIVAARAQQTSVPLAALAGELGRPGERLDALDAGDPASQMRAVFSWSYLTLSPDAARLFRLLSLHFGPDLSLTAAATLAGQSVAATRNVLAELARANLVGEDQTGRYALHDLLRVYAADLTDSEEERREAVRRLLDHYLHTAYAAALLLHPTRDPIDLDPPSSGVLVDPPADLEAAQSWFATEHASLVEAVEHAAARDWDTHAWQLAWTLADFLTRVGLWADWAATAQTAVAAASRLGDPSAEARSRRLLAGAYLRLRRFEDADRSLQHALDLYSAIGDLVGQAHTEHNLGTSWGHRGNHAAALHHAVRALDLYSRAGYRSGQAMAHNAIGWYCALSGEHERAIPHCRQALSLLEELEDRPLQGATWHTLGYAHHQLGRHTEAIAGYQRAAELHREFDAQVELAQIIADLGDAYRASGDVRAAHTAWQESFAILAELGHPDAEAVRIKLGVRAPSGR